MPNANYRAGSRLERLWMAQMKQKGYAVVRSAGSRGVIDCIAWNETEIIMAQIKNGNRAWNAADLETLRQLPRPANASVLLVIRDGGIKEWECIPC
jgi:Holliday junction resolvase